MASKLRARRPCSCPAFSPTRRIRSRPTPLAPCRQRRLRSISIPHVAFEELDGPPALAVVHTGAIAQQDRDSTFEWVPKDVVPQTSALTPNAVAGAALNGESGDRLVYGLSVTSAWSILIALSSIAIFTLALREGLATLTNLPQTAKVVFAKARCGRFRRQQSGRQLSVDVGGRDDQANFIFAFA
jgi:hypothetical protein